MAHTGLRWKVTSMKWPFFPEIIILVQFGSVLFGTGLAAPLLSSLNEKNRLYGFICMALGSLFSLIATASVGLWVLALANGFWFFSSLRGWWLLADSTPKSLQVISDTLPDAPTELVNHALDNMSDALVETGQAVADAISIDNNRPPDAT